MRFYFKTRKLLFVWNNMNIYLIGNLCGEVSVESKKFQILMSKLFFVNPYYVFYIWRLYEQLFIYCGHIFFILKYELN